ncbi:hypothetical protein OG963_07800 [Streptomyces sp. NBC_01707]|uniref:4-coumarate--CoA ligase family protein n=1 Tax=unclassified Streptomyces TaxID=2593676 RepID=UPI000A5F427F|nr:MULTISPECIES: 4-coumarate--CoA ligase family protein [unclassified Streptomyces]MDX3771472.1 hypothetical protein [Streptomyces sp. AK08-01B]MDX3815441.1 hypothetical protein [Streptomyces sp. AK08-01A]
MTSRSAPSADLDALRTGDPVDRLKVLIEHQGCRVPPAGLEALSPTIRRSRTLP